MSLQTDIQRDWQFIDGVEEITFTAKGAQSGVSDSTATGVKVLFRELTENNSRAFGGVYFDPGTVLIEVWNARATGSTNLDTALGRSPRKSDLITQSDSTAWQINQITYSPITNRWKCACSQVIDT